MESIFICKKCNYKWKQKAGIVNCLKCDNIWIEWRNWEEIYKKNYIKNYDKKRNIWK